MSFSSTATAVMRGLDPRTHVFSPLCRKDGGGRVKPGHDEGCHDEGCGNDDVIALQTKGSR